MKMEKKKVEKPAVLVEVRFKIGAAVGGQTFCVPAKKVASQFKTIANKIKTIEEMGLYK